MQPAVRQSLRPRLIAIAPGASEVVRCAGGWLFDKVLGGWDVTVITAEDPDRRPLRILGVRDVTLDHALSFSADGSCLTAIAVSAELYDTDERVRDMVLRAAESGMPEIWLWGEGDEVPKGFAAGSGPVAHRLSVAARAFKAQAMAAAAICGQGPADTEVFRRGEIRRLGLASVR